jgi:hypothetical protein
MHTRQSQDPPYPLPVREGQGEDELQRKLVRTYEKFGPVQAIALGEYLEEVQVFVLLSVKHHDESLIIGLLDAEYILRDEFPAACMSVDYIPIGDAGLDRTTYLNSSLVWKRESP